MKKFSIIKKYSGVGLLMTAAIAMTMNSCSENIDESDLYTFTGEMMIDHFENNLDEFSSYLTILGKVHPSKRSSSTMHELLAARGMYTCFAPTNEAVALHLDSLLKIGEVESTDVSMIPDSVAEDIVFNSIIENQSYASTDFNEGALNATNMNDRYVDISTISENGQTILMVNTNSRIVKKDVEVENGYIHAVNRVLSPSKATVADLIMNTENTQFFGSLLELTGWSERILEYKDEAYDDKEEAGTVTNTRFSGDWEGRYPEHRYIGYTVFVELDSVYEANGINDVAALKDWLKQNAYYDDNTSYGDDYTSEDNAVNQFVAYHILPQMLTFGRLVIFSNEKGFHNLSPNDGKQWATNVWEYYETLGKHRRSVKVTGIKSGKRLNRHSVYRTSTTSNNYREDPNLITIPGFTISDNNGAYKNSALNGYYYPIDGILVWNADIPNKVLNERMRYDICSLLPEMMTNNCRYNKSASWYFTPDYFDNIPTMSDLTEFEYLPNTNNAGSGSWLNYQTDEFNIRGKYDFTMKLPPVPYTGTYEIRYGLNVNNNRGMAQIYIGENPNNLPAIGIPLDLRMRDQTVTGWVADSELGLTNGDAIEENDKAMRNNGYMKGPKYFWDDASHSGRDRHSCLRRIIFTGQLEAGKTYYIRFKSVLETTSAEFFFDYLEFVPKSVYNGDVAEDKW